MIEAKSIGGTAPVLARPWLDGAALRRRGAELARVLGFGVLGFGVLVLLWQIAALVSGDLPSPAQTLPVLVGLLSDPFYTNGPNDQGIGLQIWYSLGRVFTGWALGSLVAIPLGVLMGSSRRVMQTLNPVVQVLRPVSPLAWYPIGLAVYKNASSAVVFAIVITSLWPTLINTMVGVASMPEDYRNVARVFRFSPLKYLTKVLIPFALPHILTGLRLSMGTAWMVIVAGEMLAGGTGIGFFVWDSWNALSLPRVISAILAIGLVGLLLDRALDWLSRKTQWA